MNPWNNTQHWLTKKPKSHIIFLPLLNKICIMAFTAALQLTFQSNSISRRHIRVVLTNVFGWSGILPLKKDIILRQNRIQCTNMHITKAPPTKLRPYIYMRIPNSVDRALELDKFKKNSFFFCQQMCVWNDESTAFDWLGFTHWPNVLPLIPCSESEATTFHCSFQSELLRKQLLKFVCVKFSQFNCGLSS